MNTAVLNLNMYEALVDAGVKPELARKVEHRVETTFQAQQERLQARQTHFQAKVDERQGQLMTRQDGERLRSDLMAEIQTATYKLESAIHMSKADMLKMMNGQTWKLVGFVVVFNTLLVGTIKLFP